MTVGAELDSGAAVGAEAESAGGTATETEDTRPPVRVLGVRHHGPGSARALAAALEDYRPDCVLIEGPADADGLIEWAGRGLEPPVALLAWDNTDPSQASFWPMAVFSPEWQALSWAVTHGAQAHFMDLPAAAVLAARKVERERARSEADAEGEVETEGPVDDTAGSEDPSGSEGTDGPADSGSETADTADTAARGTAQPVRTDPIAELARLAGYEDPEAWWEDVVELRMEGDPFDALTEAIGLLREASPETDEATLRREAHMRKVLRAARRAGHERIAVVCGAWHAPALAGRPPKVAQDNARLKGMAKARTSLTWVPWTHQRLAGGSGYSAGVESPGWYHLLFTAPDRPVVRWLTQVAASLRRQDLPVSSAHIIEAARLAQSLAALRGRPCQSCATAVRCGPPPRPARSSSVRRSAACPTASPWSPWTPICARPPRACAWPSRRLPGHSPWTCASPGTWPSPSCCDAWRFWGSPGAGGSGWPRAAPSRRSGSSSGTRRCPCRWWRPRPSAPRWPPPPGTPCWAPPPPCRR